ncbi:hypothetical protein BTUL_0296g00020 [Botrytis tulipae]|uniref:Uncharacterized protein n=1 Tax=Botrytis tulipae TaxID=87230 RepID=A0A4Z1E5J6_9HELO|nr:hypothetical protein BTUL_0296g00020 [Botrytis tulipae]
MDRQIVPIALINQRVQPGKETKAVDTAPPLWHIWALPSAATNTAEVAGEPGRSHSVRALAMSKIVVKKRKTPSKIDGRSDFECSRGDKSPIAMVAARSSAAVAMVARVRNAAYRGSVHKTSRANLSRHSTTMVT